MIGKVRFADDKQAGHVAHQIIINPEPAHGIVDCRVNSHRQFIGVFTSYLFVNFEQISVAFPDRSFAEPLDCVGKIEINAAPAWANAAAFVANFFGCARRNIPRRKIAVTGIFSLEIIIALVFGDFVRRFAVIFLAFGDPDASIIAERFGHESQLRLMLATDGDAGRMNLRKARISEQSAFLKSAVSRSYVATARIC